MPTLACLKIGHDSLRRQLLHPCLAAPLAGPILPISVKSPCPWPKPSSLSTLSFTKILAMNHTPIMRPPATSAPAPHRAASKPKRGHVQTAGTSHASDHGTPVRPELSRTGTPVRVTKSGRQPHTMSRRPVWTDGHSSVVSSDAGHRHSGHAKNDQLPRMLLPQEVPQDMLSLIEECCRYDRKSNRLICDGCVDKMPFRWVHNGQQQMEWLSQKDRATVQEKITQSFLRDCMAFLTSHAANRNAT